MRCQSWLRWELILIDDESDRRAHLQVARRWVDRDGRIRVINLDRRRGRSGARNVAIAESLGAAGYRTAMSGKWHVGGTYPRATTTTVVLSSPPASFAMTMRRSDMVVRSSDPLRM